LSYARLLSFMEPANSTFFLEPSKIQNWRI